MYVVTNLLKLCESSYAISSCNLDTLFVFSKLKTLNSFSKYWSKYLHPVHLSTKCTRINFWVQELCFWEKQFTQFGSLNVLFKHHHNNNSFAEQNICASKSVQNLIVQVILGVTPVTGFCSSGLPKHVRASSLISIGLSIFHLNWYITLHLPNSRKNYTG